MEKFRKLKIDASFLNIFYSEFIQLASDHEYTWKFLFD